jgi:hypothetical protein
MQRQSSLSPTRHSCRGWIARLTCLLKWFRQGGSHSGPRKMSPLASISFVRYRLADCLTDSMVILCPDCVMLQIGNWKSKEDGKQTFFSRVCLFVANDDSIFYKDFFTKDFFTRTFLRRTISQGFFYHLNSECDCNCRSNSECLYNTGEHCSADLIGVSLACIFKYISIIKANIITTDNLVQLIQSNAFNSNAFNPIHNFLRVENKLFTS